MKVIGTRKKRTPFRWIISMIFGIILIIAGIIYMSKSDGFAAMYIVLGLGCLLWPICSLILYCSTPVNAIVLLNENEILIDNKIKISISNIVDVSYVKATFRWYQYKWGTVIIKANGEAHRIAYVANCESVQKELTALVYAKKNEINEEKE